MSVIASTEAISKTTKDGLHVTVRAKPATAKEKALRVVEVADGKFALEVSVNAVAQDGKANKALCERLAGFLGVSKSCVTVTGGAKARLKTLHISGDSATLRAKLDSALS